MTERVDVRAESQRVLDRETEPLQLAILLAEGVLRDEVGGPHVMAEQCDHLIEMARRPTIDLRLLGRGRAPSSLGGFELLTRPNDVEPFMAVTLSVDGPSYIDVADRVAKFVTRFRHLVDTAVSPAATIKRIEDIRDTHIQESHHR